CCSTSCRCCSASGKRAPSDPCQNCKDPPLSCTGKRGIFLWCVRRGSLGALGGVLGQQGLDRADGVGNGRDGHVVVQRQHEVSRILRHVHVQVPVALEQLGLAVGQVGAHHKVQHALLHGGVELGQAGGEQGEGGVRNDAGRAALLEL